MTHTHAQWLTAQSVSVSVCDAGTGAILDQMIALLERTGLVTDKAALKTDILNREALGSTEICPGVLIPHAQSTGVSGFCAAVAVVERKTICVLAAWPQVSYTELKTLALFIELLQDGENRKRLLSSPGAEQLFATLQEHFSARGIEI